MQCQTPNILLITTDTQRTDTLGCMGSAFARSPCIDRLAAEGVCFQRAYTASPACMPARCSMLTGLYPPLHGCLENGISRYPDTPVFPDALKEKGYRTIMIGKTHFGPVPRSFDVQELVRGEKGQQRADDFSHFFREKGLPEASRWPNKTPEEDCLDSLIVDRTLQHLEWARADDVPFFAFCSLLSPHAPLDPPGRWENLYAPDSIPEARTSPGDWMSLPESLRQLCGLPRGTPARDWTDRLAEAQGNTADRLSKEDIRCYKALYYGSAAFCDALVGRITAYLDRSGLRENTLIIFTSDHGQQYFDHGFNDKHNYYEETLHVPLILSMPGTLPQGIRAGFACTTDIAPTIAAAAGAEYLSANGYDLYTPLLHGALPSRVFCASVIQRSLALVTQRWKLAYYLDEDEACLFDLKRDPGEDQNIAYAAEYAPFCAGLLGALLTWHAALVNPAAILDRTGGGGPVARRAAHMFEQFTGRQSEELLAAHLQKVAGRFSQYTEDGQL